jgi:hypothetical protein
MTTVNLLVSLLGLVLFVVLALYVTYLFASRVKHRQSPGKSFLVWLRDLFDLATGLG